MKQYLDLLERIIDSGADKGDRTGTGTRSIFGHQMRFDLSKGFPLLTTKRLHFKSIAHELLWMISGSTNVKDLQKHGVTIWDEWADKETGELGPIYGKQWRAWETRHHGPVLDKDGHEWWMPKVIDQLKDIVERIKTNPDCRRLVVSAWNPADIPSMALAPCHCLFQFYVANGRLSCQLYQRSADVFLGVPYNIASYALLTHLVARHTGLEVGEFIWTGGDTHLYANHFDQAETQLARREGALPTLAFTDDAPIDLFEIRFEHLIVNGYLPAPSIAAPIAV